MNTKLTTKHETKTALLEVGMQTMMEKGYTNTGIQEVLSRLGVAKGSFYYYFDSKEAYAVEIIRYFDQGYSEDLLRLLTNQNRSSLARLEDYCLAHKERFIRQDCRKACLIGNLSQEMADQSEVLRKELCLVMGKWRNLFAACIAEGQTTGEIKATRSSQELAELFSSAWSGAMMVAKTLKTTGPLDTFTDLFFNEVLRP